MRKGINSKERVIEDRERESGKRKERKLERKIVR